MKVESAQPQTILAEDGFPIENLKFCSDAQEIMAVIQGRKPVAINGFDKTYVHMDFSTTLVSKKKKLPFYHHCKPYTYEQVYKASKQVNLLRAVLKSENDTLYYSFLTQNMKDAYLFSKLWENTFPLQKYDLQEKEVNILIGHLLGYAKKDICAWFLMELQDLFSITFDNLDKRASILKNQKIQTKRNEIAEEFEQHYASALGKLETIKKDLKVPSVWKAKLQKLPAPVNQSATRKHKHRT